MYTVTITAATCPQNLEEKFGSNYEIDYNPRGPNGELIPGSTASITCISGLTPIPQSESPDIIQCQGDGTWERPPNFRCERKINNSC